ERTRAFALRVIKLYQFLDEKRGASRVLGAQLLKAGTSIGANVAEAKAGQSRADFISKYSIAHKEARETYYWLTLLKDAALVPASRLNNLISECDEIVRILTTILVKSKASDKKVKTKSQ
ncbi:MAG: four helix bundle protein, partial [bacterium]